jgi:hypothetical protein
MTNQRRTRFIDLFTTDDAGEARRSRVMESAFWLSTSTDANARVIDLATVRASRAAAPLGLSRAQ